VVTALSSSTIYELKLADLLPALKGEAFTDCKGSVLVFAMVKSIPIFLGQAAS